MYITQEKQTLRYREQTSGYQWGGGGGNIRREEWEAHIIGCKIGSRTYCTTWGI